MLAPGDPVPETSGAGAVRSGEARLRICADACAGGKRKIPTATAAAAHGRQTIDPHPNIAFFLDLNHGIFMPGAVRQGGRTKVVKGKSGVRLTRLGFHPNIYCGLWPGFAAAGERRAKAARQNTWESRE
ncbi:MAG: hypothetical protein ABSE22_20855 [Xanthobacteraceae bacterium]|jgi:hypothetical protein